MQRAASSSKSLRATFSAGSEKQHQKRNKGLFRNSSPNSRSQRRLSSKRLSSCSGDPDAPGLGRFSLGSKAVQSYLRKSWSNCESLTSSSLRSHTNRASSTFSRSPETSSPIVGGDILLTVDIPDDQKTHTVRMSPASTPKDVVQKILKKVAVADPENYAIFLPGKAQQKLDPTRSFESYNLERRVSPADQIIGFRFVNFSEGMSEPPKTIGLGHCNLPKSSISLKSHTGWWKRASPGRTA